MSAKEIKVYGILTSGLSSEGVIDNKEVVGGYMSLTENEMINLNVGVRQSGMTVFCSTDNKYYRLDSNKITWSEVNISDFATAGDGIKIENGVISLDIANFTGGSF